MVRVRDLAVRFMAVMKEFPSNRWREFRWREFDLPKTAAR
jgi:hypothetical protein